MPVSGAVLIIAAANRDTLVGRLLVMPPMLAIGLWSYSIYLWHQPVFALARYHWENPGAVVMTCLTGAILGIGYLSWRYVEGPFRKSVWQGRRLAVAAAAGAAFFLVFGTVGKHRIDLLKRFAPAYESQAGVEQMLQRNFGLDRECDVVDAGRQCQTAEAPAILLWGDSYAMHLADGIVASHPDARLIQRTMSACGPLLDMAPVIDGNLQAAESCMQFNHSVLTMLRDVPTIRHVVLASLFYQYLKPGNTVLTADGTVVRADQALLIKALRNTTAQLREMKIELVLVAPPPADGNDIGKCLARSVLLGRLLDYCDFPVANMSLARRDVYRLLSEIAVENRVIWLHDLMCSSGGCASHIGDVFLFLDEGHLSREGSALLGRRHDFHGLIVGGGSATGLERH